MLRRKQIPNYSYQTYLTRIRKLPEYIAWRNYVNKHRKELREQAIYYHSKGLSYVEIAKKIGVSDTWRNKDTVSFILALSLCMMLLMSIVETLKLLKL